MLSTSVKTKLRSRFIGQFKVVDKKGLAYTLNLPKKMRTHPVFYVGLLKPYRDPARVSAEALAPDRHVVAEPREARWRGHRSRGELLKMQQRDYLTVQLSDLTLQVCDPVRTRFRKLSDLPLEAHNSVVNRLRGLDPVHPQLHLIGIYRLVVNVVVRVVDARVDRAKTLFQRCDSRREYLPEARPPPALLDECGDLHYHVERLVVRCGRTQ
ncbi:hypothetical protein PI124_g19668 [Phytophthora idaei]|nr:hypothetical protein PI125_g19911 [Phytophthora idaei]KAG3141947.1 hypothetical protein PI126_g15268 [Phytophthora idaei]KAG3235295.1 hypothetical protein PI124_g19668 [Phytophthora idaei]